MRQRIVTRKIAALGCHPEFWLICLFAWLLASAFRSLGTPWAEAARTEMLRWGIGIGLALALSAALHRTGTAARWLMLAAGGLVFCGIWDGLRQDRGGLVGPYQDHQLYGSALLVLLPVSAALALTEHQTRWRLAAQAVTGAGILCLILSHARSAWCGLLAAALVFGWLWLKRSQSPHTSWRLPTSCFAALLLGLIGFWTQSAPAEIRVPLEARAATLSHLRSDWSWQERLCTWRGAAKMIISSPVIGNGLGRYPGAQALWTYQGRLLRPALRPSLSEEAHNLYLQTAAETGLIGLALYMAVLTAFAGQSLKRLALKRWQRPGRRDGLVLAILSMVAGQSVDALASPSWQFPEVSLLFWAIMGIGLAVLRRPETKVVRVGTPRPRNRAAKTVAAGIAAVLLASQVVPAGLMTPVEAYASPSGWTVRTPPTLSVTANSVSSGQTVTYTLIAHYYDGSHTPIDVDVSTDSKTTYTALVKSNSKINYNANFTGNVFTAPVVTSQTLLTVSAYYYDTRISSVLKQNAAILPDLIVNP